MYAFPLDSFLGRFPEFANEEVYPIAKVQNCGDRAMLHITPSQMGMPMHGFYREYALFLMTAAWVQMVPRIQKRPRRP